MDKEELITSLEVVHFQIGIQEFLKDSLTLRDRAFFHELVHTSGETDRVFMKILSQI